MRWASRPVTKPASTSPEPAVASHGGALSLMAARPSGAAMTVSGPLRMTTAPLAGGRARAFELDPLRITEKPRELALVRGEHDGPVRVSATVERTITAGSLADRSGERRVSASASSTAAAPEASTA